MPTASVDMTPNQRSSFFRAAPKSLAGVIDPLWKGMPWPPAPRQLADRWAAASVPGGILTEIMAYCEGQGRRAGPVRSLHEVLACRNKKTRVTL